MRILGLAVAILLTATAGGRGEVRRIRLCADPSNLPFSSQNTQEPGFEVEIARAIAEALGAELSVHWFPTAREILAFGQLYEGRCDLFMGLPLTERFAGDKPRLIFSIPYYVMRQVVVSSSLGAFRSLDELKSRLVGVQAMTIGDHMVYERGYNRKVYLSPEATFDGLGRGEVDAVVLESPLAGWFVKKNPGFRATEINDPARDLTHLVVTESLGQWPQRRLGQVATELDAAGDRLRKDAQHQQRVGDRGPLPATSIAGRAGPRSGAVGSHPQ